MMLLLAIAVAAIWTVLILGRGSFWRCRDRDDAWSSSAPRTWPDIVAVVPARNENEVIVQSMAALLRQDYQGRFHVILVDDDSTDGTAETASALAQSLGKSERLTILTNRSLPAGWTGKLHAMARGVRSLEQVSGDTKYILFCDADIALAEDTVSRLVARAEQDGRVLVSLMAKLSIQSWPEKLMIPAFIYFFAKLYPFAWVADPARRTAAAAGGCMLVDRASLAKAGGLDAIRHEIIDDCAMGKLMKRQGPILLALTERAQSLRLYQNYHPIRRMITRSAFAELHYSPLRLLVALGSLVLTYATPVGLALLGTGFAQVLGIIVTAAMMLSFVPILRFYRLSPLVAVALPGIAMLYGLHTLESAIMHWQGRGGLWKGRYQAPATTSRPQ